MSNENCWELIEKVLGRSRRVLLFGPPGTGKTYSAVKQNAPLQMSDYQALQSYLILLLSSDQHFPIRRGMDWTNFKIKDIDIQEDNYMTNEMLVFNKYKTSKTKGQQRLEFANYKTKANSMTTNPSWDFYTKKRFSTY